MQSSDKPEGNPFLLVICEKEITMGWNAAKIIVLSVAIPEENKISCNFCVTDRENEMYFEAQNITCSKPFLWFLKWVDFEERKEAKIDLVFL